MSTLTLEKAIEATTWKIDTSHSTAAFSVRHMMIANVHGEFKQVEGTVVLDESNPQASSIDVRIQTSSIATNDEKRDAHLKSPDFFDAEKYPELTFKSTKWEKTGDQQFAITGDLTIKGVTKQVVLKAEGPSEEIQDPWGGTRIAFTAETKINRKDFGLEWNIALETGGFLVGDTVKITIDAQLVKQ